MVIDFRENTDKLEFARRAGGQVVTGVVCNRFHPDPLGIVLWRYKSEFVEERLGIEQHCHSEPVRRLVWESPSNSRQPIVIQSVLLCRFPGFIHEKWYVYPWDCHASVRYFIAMTGNSINSNL